MCFCLASTCCKSRVLAFHQDKMCLQSWELCDEACKWGNVCMLMYRHGKCCSRQAVCTCVDTESTCSINLAGQALLLPACHVVHVYSGITHLVGALDQADSLFTAYWDIAVTFVAFCAGPACFSRQQQDCACSPCCCFEDGRMFGVLSNRSA